MLHEGGKRDAASDRRLITGVVDEVNRARLRHEVDGGNEHDEEGGAEDLDYVQVERFHDAHDFLGTHHEELDDDSGHDGDEEEGENVVHEVLVTQFHVLELDGRREVRQDLRHFF